ncbi:hypothetical protein H257_13037 [Aphanomyces astaci]|uniref:Uncharacterized protein n=1 Tax=Aphanomyces astaci TaxID=112090 RepID=W4FWP1_APHAT|nr:hypothetical protein H257_13037 [Aphanomyces astaci]ETV71907.1 hypothetical protein H257_13037 [Aphanomyces astaci]|eukprot:XP_009838756.1 hypothetical protein H257_13037 [Aphanomyces astaci]
MPPRKGKYTDSQANTSSDTIEWIHEKTTSKRILWTKDDVGDGKSTNTGQGVEGEDSIQKEVKRMCPYYYTLDDVMRDWASITPLVTSETLYNASSGDDDETQDDKKARSSARKRSAASEKLDECGDINARAY